MEIDEVRPAGPHLRGHFSVFLEERSGHISVFQHLKMSAKRMEALSSRESHMEKTKSKRYKFPWERFHLDIRKKGFLQQG